MPLFLYRIELLPVKICDKGIELGCLRGAQRLAAAAIGTIRMQGQRVDGFINALDQIVKVEVVIVVVIDAAFCITDNDSTLADVTSSAIIPADDRNSGLAADCPDIVDVTIL